MSAPATSAFVSYSSADSDFALQLAKDLKAAGAKVWLDQLDIRPGHTWDNAIEDAIEVAPQMLIVLSPASVRSENVRDEISRALRQRKIIIPVLFQDCVVPLRLERIQHIDFRTNYASGLAALLRQLDLVQPDAPIVKPPDPPIIPPTPEIKPNPAAHIPETIVIPSAPEQSPAPPPDWKKKAEQAAMLRAQQQEQQLREAARERERRLREQAQAEIHYSQSAPMAAPPPMAAAPPPRQSKSGPLRTLIVIAVIVLAAIALAIFFFSRPSSKPDPKSISAPIVEPTASPVTMQPEPSTESKPIATPKPVTATPLDSDPKDVELLKNMWKVDPAKPSSVSKKSTPPIRTLESTPEKQAVKDQQLCNSGIYDACASLGFSYEVERGVPRDLQKANALYEKACDGRSAGGCAMLGMNYRSGKGLPADPAKANELLTKSCKLGSETGCDQLKKK